MLKALVISNGIGSEKAYHDIDVIQFHVAHGGTLFVSTLDLIVEHGIQQIRHLDHFVDNLTIWLCGIRPEGIFSILAEAYGVQTEAFLSR